MKERVVGLIIQRKDGKILLTKSPKWNGMYVLPGGHIEKGETVFEAAVREGKEETGLELTPVKIVRTGEIKNPPEFHRPVHLDFIHVLLRADTPDVKLDGVELDDYVWESPKNALSRDDINERIRKSIQLL